jgi:lipopolysaccharide export system protein LptA
MGTYRLIRILRAVLPVIVLILIGIPARNYWRSRDRSIAAEPKMASPAGDLAIHTVGLTFDHSEGGRRVFHVTANEQFFFKDNTHKLRDVHLVIWGEKPGDFDRTISGDQCIYDEGSGYVHFTGNVKAQLDATTGAHTEELIYNHQDHVITSPVRTHIEQPGEMTGDSDRLKYSMDSELLLLTGNVAMKMSNGESLHTGVGEFQKKENWTAVSGGVYLEASNGWLRGTSGRADLQPGTYRPLNVTVDGDVTSESHSVNSMDTLKTHSNSMTTVLTPAGAIMHVSARGEVLAVQLAGGATKTITGSEVEAALNDHGHVETMEARRSTSPFAKMIESDRSLTSETIQIESDGGAANSGTVTTKENSTLVAGDTTITGRNFTLVEGDRMSFTTRSPATIVSNSKDSGQRRTSASNTEAIIDGKTNALEKLTQTGNFTFKEGERSGSADKGVFTEGGSKADLTGHFSFKEGTRSGNAGRALLTDNGNTIEMWDSVEFKDGARHGTAGHAKFLNGGDIVNLDAPATPGARAVVIDDEKKMEIHAQTISMNQKTNGFVASNDVFTISKAQPEIVRVTAKHAESTGDLMKYDGNVVLDRGKTTHIEAETITPDKNNGFTATGKGNSQVLSQMEGMQAQANELRYDDTTKTATYTGKVHAIKDEKKGKMKLDADNMTIITDSNGSGPVVNSKTGQNGQLKELTANGRVIVNQGQRVGTGDHLHYDFAADQVTLTADKGSQVTIDDPPNASSRNVTWAQWVSAGGTINLKNDQGGKVTSKLPIK